MKMRKFPAMLLLLLLTLALAGCSADPQQTIIDAARAKDGGGVLAGLEDLKQEPETQNLEDALADAQAALTGDMTTGEVQQLIQGNLDTMFRGEFSKDYQELVGATEEELRQQYQAGLDIEADVFEQYFSIEYDNEALRARIVAFYEQVYPKCDFTVGEVSRDGDGFTAQVSVRPLDIMDLIVEDMNVAAVEFSQYYTEEMVEAMTDEEYEAYDGMWAEVVMTVAEENLPDIGYLPERTTQVRVELEDGYWMLTDESIQELDLLMIQY